MLPQRTAAEASIARGPSRQTLHADGCAARSTLAHRLNTPLVTSAGAPMQYTLRNSGAGDRDNALSCSSEHCECASSGKSASARPPDSRTRCKYPWATGSFATDPVRSQLLLDQCQAAGPTGSGSSRLCHLHSSTPVMRCWSGVASIRSKLCMEHTTGVPSAHRFGGTPGGMLASTIASPL